MNEFDLSDDEALSAADLQIIMQAEREYFESTISTTHSAIPAASSTVAHDVQPLPASPVARSASPGTASKSELLALQNNLPISRGRAAQTSATDTAAPSVLQANAAESSPLALHTTLTGSQSRSLARSSGDSHPLPSTSAPSPALPSSTATGSAPVHDAKRGPGRPPGTGWRQIKRAAAIAGGFVPPPPRPRGRPPTKERSSPEHPDSVQTATPLPLVAPAPSLKRAARPLGESMVPSSPPVLGVLPVTSGYQDPLSTAADLGDFEPQEGNLLNTLLEDGDGGDEEDEDEAGDSDDVDDSSVRYPNWLMEKFHKLVNESTNRDDRDRPPIYQQKSFWFHQQSNFFALDNSNISPTDCFNPRFFLWDPFCLVPHGIACPHCKSKLARNGVLQSPRRVVDMEGCFYLIGYRYRCTSCVHPVTKKKNTVSFNSWNPLIMDVLPAFLSCEFPAILTKRRGISKTLFSYMRSAFQNGMPGEGFVDAIRSTYLRQHDEAHLQYRQVLMSRSMSVYLGQTYQDFPEFHDRSPEGFGGYIPKANLLYAIYTLFIERHDQAINQYMAMLPCDFAQQDHSFKVTKQFFKYNGMDLFSGGLWSLVNNIGQLRKFALVFSKAQSQYEMALKEMSHSLNVYGHIQPRIFWTDNMVDKQFLEKIFPSLLDGVVPVETYSHLPTLSIPSDIYPLVLDSVAGIEHACSIISDSLQGDEEVVVGFDSEWNVDLLQHTNTQSTRKPTAVIQIAFKKHIWIFQAGHRVTSDLKFLEEECQSSQPFQGALELATFAKDRRAIKHANVSLADICAIVLHRNLPKNVTARISRSWADEEPPPDHIAYAARDAYASLLLYEKLAELQPLSPLPDSVLPGTRVFLYQSDHTTIIASGRISVLFSTSSLDSINITPTRTVMSVQEVLVPGAAVSLHKKLLKDFGEVPFNIVCSRTFLRIGPECLPPMPPPPVATTSSSFTDPDPEEDSHCDGQDCVDMQLDDSDAVGNLLNSFTPTSPTSDIDINAAEIDAESQSLGNALQDPSVISYPLRSCVLKDAFHVMNQFYLPRNHGLRGAFLQAMSSTLFIVDPEDKSKVCAVLCRFDPPKSWDDAVQFSPDWLWRHVKRNIPPPEILYPQLFELFKRFGPLKDAKTGAPLFNKKAWNDSKNILELVRKGFVSDPPGIPLYYVVGLNSKAGGLPIYRCIRGTNSIEGGVHSSIWRALPKSGVSPRHMLARLKDYGMRHNLIVGSFNTTGQKYKSHYDIWLINQLQESIVATSNLVPDSKILSGWVNGNLYEQSSEQFGILPIPPVIANSTAMQPFNRDLDGAQKHAFLAEKQGTRKAALPVHTLSEYRHFRSYMQDPTLCLPSGLPNWKVIVQEWNRMAENDPDVYYKLAEHLEGYFSQWQSNLNIKQSLRQSATARAPIQNILNNPRRAIKAPSALESPLPAYSATKGLLPNPGDLPDQPPLIALASSSASQPPRAPPPLLQQMRDLARKRALEENTAQLPEAKKCKKRRCMRCLREDCKGTGGQKFCRNPCHDGGKYGCRGRNRDRPDVVCYYAFE